MRGRPGPIKQRCKFTGDLLAALSLASPGIFVNVIVTAVNFVGGGLRDAADPHL